METIKKIQVTKSFLPPKEDYLAYIDKIWESKWLTNNGPFARELEQKLASFLDVKHVLFVANGTLALQVPLKVWKFDGEVITTPFSYVATTSSIMWENCTPVFADIDPNTCCISPEAIEAAITARTQAIMTTHVYGIPSDVEAIEAIARKHKLKVVYDGAHAFGGNYKGRSILSYGDVSTVSFHATKLYHSVEGGAIITNDDELAAQMKLARSFGHIGDEHYSLGINCKNSEFHAAMGLAILPYFGEIVEKRKEIFKVYDAALPKLKLKTVTKPAGLDYNYPYYPVFFESEEEALRIKEGLEKSGIFTRRYFFPSLNLLPYLTGQECPVAERLAVSVLCLPLYHDLSIPEAEFIVERLSQLIDQK